MNKLLKIYHLPEGCRMVKFKGNVIEGQYAIGDVDCWFEDETNIYHRCLSSLHFDLYHAFKRAV